MITGLILCVLGRDYWFATLCGFAVISCLVFSVVIQ